MGLKTKCGICGRFFEHDGKSENKYCPGECTEKAKLRENQADKVFITRKTLNAVMAETLDLIGRLEKRLEQLEKVNNII